MQQYTPNTELVRQYARDADALGLSVRAKERLTWLLHYCENGHSVSATCRQFGIPRMTLYRVLQRFEFDDPKSLEDQSRRPHAVRPRVAAPAPVVAAPAVQQSLFQAPAPQEHRCLHPHCVSCMAARIDLGRKLKSAFLLGSVLVNVAFLSFLLVTALYEGRSATAESVRPAISSSLLP